MSKARLYHHTSQIKPLASAIAACLALSAMPSQAATFTVNSHADMVAGSLRAVIASANSSAGADTIVFNSALSGVTLTLASQIDISDELTIDASALANGFTISGNNNSRVFGVTENKTLTLKNLTLTQGRTTADTTTSVPDCALATFTRGGAICAEGDLNLIDSTISDSSTTGSNAYGGGFFAGGLVNLYKSNISGNHTEGEHSSGGGFFAVGAAIMNHISISGNSTAGENARGGGFFARDTAFLGNSSILGNSTAGSDANGGGFFARRFSTLTNSTVSENTTAGEDAYGGGFNAGRNTSLINSTVSENTTAGEGANGGGFVAYSDVTLKNSTISQNTANHVMASGDGIYLIDYVRSGSTLILNSSILAGNGADNFDFRTPYGLGGGHVSLDATNSLFGDAAAEVDHDNGGNILNNNNPALAPLADNSCTIAVGTIGSGECVQTHGLLASSPALNAGADNGLTTDQRGTGFPRVVGGQADIGAFEGQISASTPGDCTGDGAINISDVVCTINIVLGGGVAVNGADCNESGGAVDISDVICTINEVLNP
jgi:hypothetical protein